ncbi:unnamed protein product, partial [Symbiodinium sp. CCMP2456]
VLPLAEAEEAGPRRKAERELDVAPVLGSALGALASAGYWEGALAHLGSTPSPACPSGTGDDGALASALEASAVAKAEVHAAALAEASKAGLKLKDLDEKVVRHNREHWLGLECLQEKVGDLSATQKALHEQLSASLKKDVHGLREHIDALSTKCQAMADAVTTLRTEMGRKASHEQLEDLEHQQCKAFERFVGRWEACAEARRRNLQDEVSSALCEVQRPAAKASEGQLRPGEAVPLNPMSSWQMELQRKVDELQARLPAGRVSAAGANRLEDLCQMQTELKRELAGLRTELSNQVSQLKLEGATEARTKSTLSEHWEQRYQSLTATVDSLKAGLEATRRSIKEASAMREQAWLDGLRLRVDACAEGVASEVRIREESTQRLECLLQKTRQDLEAKIDAVGGALEKQFHGVLASQNDKGLHLELMGAMQLELQKRQDAETSLRDLQCEMVEMRSKLLRKEHALLEASGFREPSKDSKEVAREPSKEEPTTWRPGLTGTLFSEPMLSREPAPSNGTGPSPETASPLSDLRASSTPAILRPKMPPRFQQWPT